MSHFIDLLLAVLGQSCLKTENIRVAQFGR